jgi:hypothetical protein
MANQQNQQGQQNQQRQESQESQQRPAQEQNGRSEDLLPAGAADNTADGRFEVAEEVNMDQQSDAARRVGKPPKGIASEALADSLKPDAPKK